MPRHAVKGPGGIIIALLLPVLASPFLASGPAASAAPHPWSGTPALPKQSTVTLTWTPEYMSSTHNYTQAQAVAIAQKFDVVAAMPAAFSRYAAAMRAANPNLKLLTYSNAMFAAAKDYSGLPSSAFAHTTSGAQITSAAFGMTLMEPSSSAWRARSTSLCQTAISSSGYDGCLLDMLTMGVFAKGYVSGIPAKPGAGRDYTQSEWRQGLISVATAFPKAVPTKVIIGNAVGNAWRYWQAPVTSQPLVASLPGAQMEDFLRGASNPVTTWPTASQWLDNVNIVKSLEASGQTGFFSTKLWVSATTAQVKQWEAYAMASFLMQANGNSYFAFTPARDQLGSTGGRNPYAMPTTLGTPTGSMTAGPSGIYSRTFSNGIALVNPTTASAQFVLSKPAKDLDGVWQTLVTLPADSGSVLLYS